MSKKPLRVVASFFLFFVCVPGLSLAPHAHVAPLQQTFSYSSAGDNFLGILAHEITTENLSRFGLREPRGVGVGELVKDSPAARAGLRENDVIVKFDGEAVNSIRKLNRVIDEAAPEHNARLTILRGGVEQDISVKLGKRKTSMFSPETIDELHRKGSEVREKAEALRDEAQKMRPEIEELMRKNKGVFTSVFNSHRRIGVTTDGLTDQLAEYFGLERGRRGVLITTVQPESAASKAGLKAGDIVTDADGERIEESGDLSRAINRKKEGPITLTIVRDRKARTVTVTPEPVPQPRMELFTSAEFGKGFAFPRFGANWFMLNSKTPSAFTWTKRSRLL